MNRQRMSHMLGLLCLLTALFYLIDAFHASAWLQTAYSISAGMLLFCAIFVVRRSNQITATILLLIGSYIFFFQQSKDTYSIVIALGQNVNLLTLFLFVPLFGVMMSIGGYLTALKHKVQQRQLKKNVHPYRVSYFITSTIGLILNLGSMPITYRMATGSFSSFYKQKMGMIILRAFGFCMFWSPYFVNIGLVLIIFDVSWLSIGWIGLIVAIVYVLISLLFNRRITFENDSMNEQVSTVSHEQTIDQSHVQSHEQTDEQTDEQTMTEATRKMKSLLFWSVLLFGLSFLLDAWLPVNMITVVSLLGLIYPIVWAITTKIAREYIQEALPYMLHSFSRLKNEIVIFISAGYFGVAISQTAMGEWLSLVILQWSFGSVYLLALIIIIMSVLLALIGVHPVIILIGVGSSLNPVLFGVSPQFMAIVLIIAWTIATQISPFSGSVLMTANLIQVSPWTIARKNVAFVICLVVILPMVLYALQWLII